jgi:hypothetical protein
MVLRPRLAGAEEGIPMPRMLAALPFLSPVALLLGAARPSWGAG